MQSPLGRYSTSMTENQMAKNMKNMENEMGNAMETGIIGLYRGYIGVR